VAREEPIDPAHVELARALLSLETEENQPEILRELRKLSINRRKSRGDTGPHLDVREESGRKDKIVVADGNSWESTRIDAVAGELPEDNVDALVYLKGYIGRATAQVRAQISPSSFTIAQVLDEFIDAHEPEAKLSPVPGLTADEIALSQGDPMEWYGGQKNARAQLKGIFKDKTLADINRDSGRWYKKKRQLEPKLNGGVAKDGTIIPPKDSTVRLQLFFLQGAIRWFLDTRKLPFSCEFEMPEFDLGYPYSLEPSDFFALKLACRGFQRNDDGTYKMKTVIHNGRERKVWDRVMIADKVTMRSIEKGIEIYAVTGTRLDSIAPLTYSPCDWHGYVDAKVGFVHRSGKASTQHDNKTRNSSKVLDFFRKRLRRWQARDEKMFPHRKGTDPLRPGDYVLHDATGGPIANPTGLLDKVFDRAGIDRRNHDLKHMAVTAYYRRGYHISRIAGFIGNKEQSLLDTYVKINWAEEGVCDVPTTKIRSFADLYCMGPRHKEQDEHGHVAMASNVIDLAQRKRAKLEATMRRLREAV
jgi:hypothetical protein